MIAFVCTMKANVVQNKTFILFPLHTSLEQHVGELIPLIKNIQKWANLKIKPPNLKQYVIKRRKPPQLKISPSASTIISLYTH